MVKFQNFGGLELVKVFDVNGLARGVFGGGGGGGIGTYYFVVLCLFQHLF